jgi:hypothetical protein
MADDIQLVDAIINQDVEHEQDVQWSKTSPKWGGSACHDRWRALIRPISEHRSLKFSDLLKRVRDALVIHGAPQGGVDMQAAAMAAINAAKKENAAMARAANAKRAAMTTQGGTPIPLITGALPMPMQPLPLGPGIMHPGQPGVVGLPPPPNGQPPPYAMPGVSGVGVGQPPSIAPAKNMGVPPPIVGRPGVPIVPNSIPGMPGQQPLAPSVTGAPPQAVAVPILPAPPGVGQPGQAASLTSAAAAVAAAHAAAAAAAAKGQSAPPAKLN